MTPLPSFVELMASLGIEEETPLSGQPRSHSRGSSVSSASSSKGEDSDFQQPQSGYSGNYLLVPARHSEGWQFNGDMDVESPCVSRHGKGRYSPYSTVRVTKRKSFPALYPSSLPDGSPDRATSTSPLRSPRFSQSPRPERTSRRRGHTWTGESELPAITPISTFVRRKSPHLSPCSSPTSTTFPHSVPEPPTVMPLAPVAIPALPTLLPPFCRPIAVEHAAVPVSSCT